MKNHPENTGCCSPGEWGYCNFKGPGKWADLDGASFLAAEGKRQSPIHIKSDEAIKKEQEKILIHYKKSAHLTVIHNGNTIRVVEKKPESFLELAGKKWFFQEFHFHTPSEHLLDSKTYPLEMHIVHKSEKGELLVLGVFMDSGALHDELENIWKVLPREKDARAIVQSFNLETLLPGDSNTYRYSGSLTTPPCSEDVRWIVYKNVLEVSRESIELFSSIFSGELFPHGNTRPVQALNGRVVYTDL